jgi:apolipoprotein N-acyltransferase
MLSQGMRMYDPKLPRSRVFLPAILSGLLLYACFFPLNLGFLAWVALVPFLSLVRANARSRRNYLAAFVGGLFCYVPAIEWIRVAHPAMYGAWIFLAICCSLFLVLSLAIIRKLDRVGIPLWLSAPIGFIAVEYFRSHFPTGYTWMEMFNVRHPIGFGWYMVGHTQHDYLQFIQIADITGVYGVTFLVVLVNAVIWSLIERRPRVRTWFRVPGVAPAPSLWPSLVAIGLLIATFAYGVFRTNGDSYIEGPRVALIQGNIEQDIKNEKGPEMVRHFGRLATEAASEPSDQAKPDLVIWPETTFAYGWYDIGPGVDLRDQKTEFQREYNSLRDLMKDCAYHWRTSMLYGLNTTQAEADNRLWRYNSALLVDAKGKPVARYDKIHLVPLGEYVPFPETFPFLKSFTPYETDYSCRPGENYTRFPLQVGDRTYHFGCLICYEDSDASLARQYVRPGEPRIDFLVNISNDGWFKGTEEHEQHLAICRFRAIETRRSVVRAVNMGISAIIDPDGRVIALPGKTWAESKKVQGIVRGNVPIDDRNTLYARFGDWLPLMGWAVIAGGIVLGFVRRRKAA